MNNNRPNKRLCFQVEDSDVALLTAGIYRVASSGESKNSTMVAFEFVHQFGFSDIITHFP